MHPIIFHIGARPIYWYGIMMAIAFLAAIAHWTWLARRSGRPANLGYDTAFWLMLAGIIGARINYVLANPADFINSPLSILRIDQGGLIYYGGFAGAIVAAIIFARRRGERLWWFADFAVSALPLGHFFGRIGCFLNGCCYGIAGDYPWCYVLDGVRRHPVQLYESAWNLTVYLILIRFHTRRKTEGLTFSLYLMLYPAGRFLLEFWRGDPRHLLLGLNMAQIASLTLITVGAVLWAYRKRSYAT